MPSLTIPNTFSAGTLIQSAQVNANFTAIASLLNTTKLDSTNIQLNGLTRNRLALGTANYVLINGADGNMSEEAQLSLTRGGTGASLSISTGDAGKAIVVNPAETGLQLSVIPGTVAGNLFNYNRLT